MIYDVQASIHPKIGRNGIIDFIGIENKDIDIWQEIQLLVQALISSNKNLFQTGNRPDQPSGLRKLIEDKRLDGYFDLQHKRFLEPLSLAPTSPYIDYLPSGSWALQFTFTLRKPYISRDDTDLYILDNPVKKEWVFKVPYIAPSQWKGSLRSSMMQELVSKLKGRQVDEGKFIEQRLRLYRLFGNEKDGTFDYLNLALARHFVGDRPVGGQTDQEWMEHLEAKTKEIGEAFESELVRRGYRQGDIDGFQGSLHFYPSYFSQIGLEVINPHNRKTGAGENPIYFECVPKDTDGSFNLLYVPLVGPETSSEKAKEDLEVVARGIKAMMSRYGFGAKTSSGFGVADVGWKDATVKPEEFQHQWQEAWLEDAR